MNELVKNNGINDDRRLIFLTGEIKEEKAEKIITRLIDLEFKDPVSPILLVIESYGGYVDSMWAIVNTMDMLRCPVYTLVLGKAMSCASFIFIHGKKGHRFVAPNCRMMFHQISGGFHGKTEEVSVTADEIKKEQEAMYKRIADKTKMTIKQVREEMRNDRYIRPKECMELGICDVILSDFGDVGIKKF